LAGRWGGVLRRQGFRAVPLQTRGVAEYLGVTPAALLERMHLRTADGRCYSGADAYVEMARARPWSRPFVWLAAMPGALSLLRRAYDWIAAHRPCEAGAHSCARATAPTNAAAKPLPVRPGSGRWLDFAPLLVATGAVLALQAKLAPWIFMWLLALALFAGCKWLTLREAWRRGLALPRVAAVRYLLGWVGMEPREFVRDGRRPSQPQPSAWIAPLARVIVGGALLWWGARQLLPLSPLAAGWAGMIGIILLLHFGLFHLLALAWRTTGYPVKPLMNHPTRAGSVGEFWGHRWNRGFHNLAHRFIYEPLHQRLGRVPSLLAVFVVSGLIHDLVITVPARGGYGLPTAYFLLQGLALALERSPAGRRLGLGRGIVGRFYAMVIIAGPAFWLFPPVFVRHVILPMLHALGAT
jgi:alginate O-acetyltransferase complex protein AlgI